MDVRGGQGGGERLEPGGVERRVVADYVAAALGLTHPGSVIIVDNVVRRGAVLDPAGDENVQGVHRLNALLTAEPRLSATTIQTVGAKGYDGFTLALVVAG